MRANQGPLFPRVVSKRNVFDWLDEVRKRPGMFIRDNSVRDELQVDPKEWEAPPRVADVNVRR